MLSALTRHWPFSGWGPCPLLALRQHFSQCQGSPYWEGKLFNLFFWQLQKKCSTNSYSCRDFLIEISGGLRWAGAKLPGNQPDRGGSALPWVVKTFPGCDFGLGKGVMENLSTADRPVSLSLPLGVQQGAMWQRYHKPPHRKQWIFEIFLCQLWQEGLAHLTSHPSSYTVPDSCCFMSLLQGWCGVMKIQSNENAVLD